MLRAPHRLALALATVLVLVLAGCRAGAGAPTGPPAQHVTVAGRALVVTTAGGEVCVGPEAAAPTCVPDAAAEEPVLSAALAPFHDRADLLLVLSRPGVTMTGLGPDARQAVVRLAGRDVVLWLDGLPVGATRICAGYRWSAGGGRLVVHRSVALDASTAADLRAARGGGDDGR